MTANIVDIEARIEKLERSVELLDSSLQALAEVQAKRVTKTQVAALGARSHVHSNGRMAIEQHISLRAAAKRAGVGDDALKRWLQKDLGICFPKVPRGSKILVRVTDVERVLAKRRDARAVRRT